MSSRTGWSMCSAKRTSRWVRMPTSFPDFELPFGPLSATTGRPLIPLAFMIASASPSVASGGMVTGFITMPLSKRFTCRTLSACSSGVRLRCTTPRPPACAMAMARRASVTVSIAEETIGRLRLMDRVRRVRRSVSAGSTSEWPGRISTSSKVSASGIPAERYFGMPTLRFITGGISIWRCDVASA